MLVKLRIDPQDARDRDVGGWHTMLPGGSWIDWSIDVCDAGRGGVIVTAENTGSLF